MIDVVFDVIVDAFRLFSLSSVNGYFRPVGIISRQLYSKN